MSAKKEIRQSIKTQRAERQKMTKRQENARNTFRASFAALRGYDISLLCIEDHIFAQEYANDHAYTMI